MRLSKLLAPSLNIPISENEINNLPTERLIERASLVNYSKDPGSRTDFLPLGQKVVMNIKNILRIVSNKLGMQEVKLSSIQSKRYLESSGRFGKFAKDILKIEDSDLILSPTHEEYLVNLLKQINFSSYRSLPIFVFQFDDVYRKLHNQSNRGGLRNSEIMVYEGYGILADSPKVFDQGFSPFNELFSNFFNRINIPFICHRLNEVFRQYLYETPKGLEKVICTQEGIDQSSCPEEKKALLKDRKVVDMAQIFSNPKDLSLKLGFKLDKGKDKMFPVIFSAGLGFYRTIYSIIDHYRDKKGISWPEGLEPFTYAVIPLYIREPAQKDLAERIYQDLLLRGEKVIFDDRNKIGIRKKSLDLIGVRKKIIIYREDNDIRVIEEDRSGRVQKYEKNP